MFWANQFGNFRVAPVRFGSGLCTGQFERFRFSVPTVPVGKGLVAFLYVWAYIVNREVPFRFRKVLVSVWFLNHPECYKSETG